MVNTFGLLLSNTEKSYIYLKYLIDNKIYPKKIYIYGKEKSRKIINLSNKLCTNIIKVKTINDKKIQKYLFKDSLKIFVYSGYPGEIIKSNKLLKNKIFIHCHPGDLPQFKGSTTIFYSILLRKKVTYSVFRLSNKLDDGDVYYSKKIKLSENFLFDLNRKDYKNRIMFISKVIRKKLNIKKKKKNKKEYLPYYVAHPIIRSLSLKRLKKITKFL